MFMKSQRLSPPAVRGSEDHPERENSIRQGKGKEMWKRDPPIVGMSPNK